MRQKFGFIRLKKSWQRQRVLGLKFYTFNQILMNLKKVSFIEYCQLFWNEICVFVYSTACLYKTAVPVFDERPL